MASSENNEGNGDIPSPSDLICVGTREISLGTSDQGKISAILAAFNHKSGSDSDNAESSKDEDAPLVLMLTDGSKTYTGRISTQDLKSTSDNTANLQSLLLEEKSNITISFGLIYIDDMAPPKVKMIVRERLESGIVKVVWNGFLLSSSAGSGSSNNAFLFITSLTSSLREGNKDIDQLWTELDKAKADMVGWKDTATKLDGKWQKEKNDLTERFLVLYNRVKADLRDVRKELSEEKKKKKVRVQPMVASALAPPEKLAPQVDDDYQEEVMWDAKQVELLAAGKKSAAGGALGKRTGGLQSASISTAAKTSSSTTAKQQKRGRVEEAPKAKKTARRDDNDSPSKKLGQGSDDDGDDDEYGGASQARANPVSGAVEMWGPEGIFADSQEDDFQAYREKRRAKKLQGSGNGNERTEHITAADAAEDAKKATPKEASPAKAKANGKKPSGKPIFFEVDSDSDFD